MHWSKNLRPIYALQYAIFYSTQYCTTLQKIERCIQKRMDRHRKLSPRGMRLLQRYVVEYCFDPLHVIAARFNEYNKLQLSVRTIKRALRRMGIHWYVAIQKLYLSKRNIAERVIRARTHQHWTVQLWSNVMFTDGSSFTDSPTKN